MAIGDADRLHAAGGWVRKYKLSELPEEAVAFEPGAFADAAHGGARYARLNARAESISVTAP